MSYLLGVQPVALGGSIFLMKTKDRVLSLGMWSPRCSAVSGLLAMLVLAIESSGQTGIERQETSMGALPQLVRGASKQRRVEGEARCDPGQPPLPEPPPGLLLIEYQQSTRQFCLAARLGDAQRTVRMPIAEPVVRRVAFEWIQKVKRGRAKRRTPLTKLLLDPVADLLEHAELVVFVPSGILHEFPFSALKLRSDRFLIEHKPIAVLPTRSLLAIRSNAAHGVSFWPALIMGDPMQEQLGMLRLAALEARLIVHLLRDARNDGWAGVRVPRHLLHRAAVQSPSMSVHVGAGNSGAALIVGRDGRTMSLIGSNATVDGLKQGVVGTRMLHLATHRIDTEEDYPNLLLGSPPSAPEPGVLTGSPGGEGWRLSTWEASCLPLADMQLVVLSGCETAVFAQGDRPSRLETLVYSVRLLGQDGVSMEQRQAYLQPADSRFTRSLAGAFLFRGVPFVLGTLWSIDDSKATVQLALDFQQHVAHGLGPAAALQCAQRAAITSGEATAAARWSAYTLQISDLESLMAAHQPGSCLEQREVSSRVFRWIQTQDTSPFGDWAYTNLDWSDVWPKLEQAVLALEFDKLLYEEYMHLPAGCLSDSACVAELDGTALLGVVEEEAPESLHLILASASDVVERDVPREGGNVRTLAASEAPQNRR